MTYTSVYPLTLGDKYVGLPLKGLTVKTNIAANEVIELPYSGHLSLNEIVLNVISVT